MKNTLSLLRTGLLQAALLIGLGLCHGLAAAATFTVTPSAVSNTYTGIITLQIGGLNTGETVRIDKFLDVNRNGLIGAPDLPVQSFLLTDGQASVFYDGTTAVTNINVPGDFNPTNGAITTRLTIASDIAQQIVAQYIFRLSSPTNRFTPQTTLFKVTNSAYTQRFTGAVQCSGTNVPNVVVMVTPGGGQHGTPFAGVMADNSGNYTLNLPAGAYGFYLFKSNFVANLSKSPRLTLTSGATFTTNLNFLIPATTSVSGHLVDAAKTNTGLPNVFMVCETPDRQFMAGACYTGTNGAFTVPVTAGQWQVSMDSQGLGTYGYLGLNNNPQVDTRAGAVSGLTLALPKATALFYGSVLDNQGHPLAGIDLSCWDNNNQYQQDYYTDANGYFVAPVVGALGNDGWQVEVSSDTAPTNYLFAYPAFNHNGGTNLNAAQALLVNFTAVSATNHISGYLKDGSNKPISGVWVWAEATINGADFHNGTDTDATGHYTFNVCNGAWWVGVSCGGGGDSLGDQYLCPDSQTVTIANNNGTANFTALLAPSQISGYVKDTSNNPIANVGVYAYMTSGGGNGPSATTDGNGHYSFYVANGSWNVGLSCCGDQSLSPLGYLCVGEQSTTVYNSSSVVSFSVPHAPYQITGHLRDGSNNPIANVSVNASGNSYNACATTAGDGSYTLYVNNGDWYINLDCGALSSRGYLCPNDQSVTVSNANVVLDFSALKAAYTISGWVRNSNNQPFTNLDVQASATIGANDYWLDSHTDANGYFSIQVVNGQWWVGVDCGGLGNGYLCPDQVSVIIAGASVVTNFTIQSCGQLQVLTTSLPGGQAGFYYDFHLQAASCYPNFYWVLFSPWISLPPGLQFDSNGEVYGTPTTNGTFNFTVQVTDGNNFTATQPLSLTIAPAVPDALEYYVMKLECLRQLDPTNLVPDTNTGPFMAKSAVVQSGLGTVPIGNLTLPGGGARAFPSGSTGVELGILDIYPSQAAMDAVYTNGNYTFTLATLNSGFHYPVLTMPAAGYPAPTRVSNFASAQAINPSGPFTLQWSNPADATTNDVIFVWITDAGGNVVFATPYPPTNYSTCLRGTATSTIVPANTLQLGGTYTGVIGFYRTTSANTTAYPGAVGVTLVGVHTAFSLAAPSSLPVLSQPTRISATQFGFLLSGAAGTNYTVLASTNAALPLSNWSQVLTTNLPGSSAFIQDNQATTQRRYYRVKVGP